MGKIDSWITKLPRLKNSKVARFSYKAEAYANDDIEGVENYDYTRDMNVPNINKTDTENSVLDSGARAQFSSLSKNALNHFFGRVSYNLNKVIDFLSDFLDDFIALNNSFISFTEIVSFSSSATLSNYANGSTKRLLNIAGSTITITLPVGETYLGSNTILLAPSIMLTIAKRGAVWINSSGNAITADRWKTARNFTISDADGTNTGAAVSVDGSENETLKLPSTIKASLSGNVSGNAGTANKWKTARNVTISDADGTNTGTAVSVDGSENETLKLPPTIKANLTGNATNGFTSIRRSANFTLPTYSDGTHISVANTHATSTITCTLPTGQTMNGQSSFTIAPDTLLEFELIGTSWKCMSKVQELIWLNPSPESAYIPSYAETTSGPIEQFKSLIFTFSSLATAINFQHSMEVVLTPTTSRTNLFVGQPDEYKCRQVYNFSGNSIQFSSGYVNSTLDQGACIPIAVYGVK